MISDGEKIAPPGGLEPPTFRLTAERASQLRHGGFDVDRVKIAIFKSEVDQSLETWKDRKSLKSN